MNQHVAKGSGAHTTLYNIRLKKKNVTDGKKLFKSAVAEHVAETYDVTGWEDDKIIDRETEPQRTK